MLLIESIKGELRFDGVGVVMGMRRPVREHPIEVSLNDDPTQIKESGLY
jgi:hypothetical protein